MVDTNPQQEVYKTLTLHYITPEILRESKLPDVLLSRVHLSITSKEGVEYEAHYYSNKRLECIPHQSIRDYLRKLTPCIEVRTFLPCQESSRMIIHFIRVDDCDVTFLAPHFGYAKGINMDTLVDSLANFGFVRGIIASAVDGKLKRRLISNEGNDDFFYAVNNGIIRGYVIREECDTPNIDIENIVSVDASGIKTKKTKKIPLLELEGIIDKLVINDIIGLDRELTQVQVACLVDVLSKHFHVGGRADFDKIPASACLEHGFPPISVMTHNWYPDQ